MSESKPFDPFMAEEIISAQEDLKEAHVRYMLARQRNSAVGNNYVPITSPKYEEWTAQVNVAYREYSAAQDELECAYLRLTSALVPGILKEIKNGDYDV